VIEENGNYNSNMKFPGFHKKKLILDKNNKTIWP
jgi:hypothetical protein